MTRTCDILPYRREHAMVADGEDNPECMLRHAHRGPHLCRSSKGLFSWKPDDECDCCVPEQRECFVFEEVTSEEALKRLQEA